MNSQATRQQVSSNHNNLNMASVLFTAVQKTTTWHHNKTWHKQTAGVPPVQSPSQVGLDRVPPITQRAYMWRIMSVPIGTKHYNITCHHNQAQRPYHICQLVGPLASSFHSTQVTFPASAYCSFSEIRLFIFLSNNLSWTSGLNKGHIVWPTLNCSIT